MDCAGNSMCERLDWNTLSYQRIASHSSAACVCESIIKQNKHCLSVSSLSESSVQVCVSSNLLILNASATRHMFLGRRKIWNFENMADGPYPEDRKIAISPQPFDEISHGDACSDRPITESHIWNNLSSDMRWRMWKMCQECVRASQWNRSHSDTCQRTFMHVLKTMPDTQTLSAHMCPSAFTLGHRFAS